MRHLYLIPLAIVLLVFSLYTIDNPVIAQTQQLSWEKIKEGTFDIKGDRRIVPQKYQIIKTNFENLKSVLRNSPFEQSDRALIFPFVIDLPMPDGNFSRFIVTEYSMMEPGLAQQFPDIRTYNIKGIDDPYAVGKIDFTMLGFHAMVLTPNGDYYIDPYSTSETDIYICYRKSDFLSKIHFECYTPQEISNDNNIINEVTTTGQQLRTYRLACAATGEYTAFFGGTAAQGQAAIVTAINRVNGVYERDMSVRMTLVANNINIVYTNSATDPYTNNNGVTMLSQNQTNLDAVIGSANYDIGHVFSTGGGGVAGLGVVCIGGNKARGVTGLPSPVGDPFYIDYVAHEMGHQFGGNHTFNSVTSNCGGGNRNASTAWEPGSGSTIMAYAGICGADDLQSNSDAYFHTGSVSEITNYTQSGNGNSCPVTTNTGNTPPSVTVPSGGFTIPISTPFSLTGSATDLETPSSLTYCWEEFDVGPSGSPNSPSGNAPIFRSFSPVTSPTRTFPKLSDLLNNTQTIGEILPTYSRNLQFKLTARDNSAGGGGIASSSLTFAVTSTAGPFLVTSPNTNVTWNTSSQTVTWNVANTTASPVSCSGVNIKLSSDGGNTFPVTLATGTPNDGSENVTIPIMTTSQARVKVEAAGNIFFDISNVNFTVNVVNAAPVITHTPLGNQLKVDWPVAVNATVTSGNAIDSAWVIWYKNVVANKKEFKLINTSGNNYSAIFNSQNSDVDTGDYIYYRIFAQNNSAGHEKDSTALLSFKITDNKLNEGFYSATFPPSNWALEYTGTQYWTRVLNSSYGIGQGSAKFNFFVAPDATDQSLISLTFTNSGPGDSLKFDHSYAPNTNGNTDTLEILSSTNAGATYVTLVRMHGNNVNGTLNTRTALGTAFTPSFNSPWQTKKFALPVGTNKLKFRARSGNGNNLYLDSISMIQYGLAVSTIKLAPEGFLNTVTSKLSMRDTISVYLRNTSPPYSIVDSGRAVIDSVSLTGTVTFYNAPSGTYYVVTGHRNTLETWSKNGGEAYTSGVPFNFDFTSAQSQAYGSNLTLKRSVYCIYSGDIVKDYTIDLSDIIEIFNDAQIFAGGYVATDLTGDGFADVSDIIIAFNNALAFVSRQAPPGALTP